MARASTPVAWGRATAAGVGLTALVALLAAMTALHPAAGAAGAGLLVLATVAAAHPAATARVAAVAGFSAAIVVTTVVPHAAVLVALAALGGVITIGTAWRSRHAAARFARGALDRAVVPASIAAAAALAGVISVWPATALLVTVVAAVQVLAWRRPALGLGAAALLFGFEGSVKVLLGFEESPLPGGNRAAGAAALDVALFGAICGVLLHDRLRTPRAVWASASRLERIAISLLGTWLALSIVQIAQGGDPGRGLEGFRLFQSYTLVAVAALTVFADPRLRGSALRGVLVIFLLVSLYAAVRVLIGPADSERAFATSVATVTMYGDALRAIGSFSSAVGLSSFLVPVSVFALVLGFLAPATRRLAWGVGVLALIGLIGSYSRASLFGVALGLACSLVVVFAAADVPRRRKQTAAALVAALLCVTYGGVLVASQASPQLRERAEGVLNPLGDESVRLRFETWGRNVEDAAGRPFGEGVGAAGAASAPTRAQVRTTDNSFLKILVEQGVVGLGLFAAGILGVVVSLSRRLRRAAPDARAVGLSALVGFVAFLGVSSVGETVEQPGKIVAWGLLGIATAQAFLRWDAVADPRAKYGDGNAQ